ncbi:MAG: preprotein translocase subunit SecY [Actinobacteria bacterium]|nr:MAG: preprotein translocase subunit SecY [Actinomycetota bacterium]
MLDPIKGFWKLPDLRKKIIFTVAIILIYRLGAVIPVPGVDPTVVSNVLSKGSIFGFLDLVTGGAFARAAIFSLGIMPYITASIIMQLLRVVIPKIEQWSKEGEIGEKKMTQWTRYLTLGLAVLESTGSILVVQAALRQAGQPPFSLATKILMIGTMVTGTVLVMWLGELITQRGIGNGMSIIITINILARFPVIIGQLIASNPAVLALFIAIFLTMIVAVVYMELGQRKVPVQYAKRIVGRKMYGGAATFIPLKVNSSGVIPIIFASAILNFPFLMVQNYFSKSTFGTTVIRYLGPGTPLNLTLEVLLIVFFAYFYTAIIFNPKDTADNLKKYGGFIPGVRPGGATAEYINNILTRLTLPGAIFLGFLAILPTIIFSGVGGGNVVINSFSGISILIIVGVSLETVRQLESQLVMRHYEGFLK